MIDIRLEPLQLSQIGVVCGVQVYPMGEDPNNPADQYRMQQETNFNNTNRLDNFNSFNNNNIFLREYPNMRDTLLVKIPEFKPHISEFDELYTRYNKNIGPHTIPFESERIKTNFDF